MSSMRHLPGDFIPAPDDVLVDGMGRQWGPSGWPVLLRDTPDDVERLAFAVEGVMLDSLWESWLDGRPADFRRNARTELARAIIEQLRGER